MRNIFLAICIFFLTGCGFEIIDTGHRGIEIRFGEVVGEALPEGFYWYNPVTSSIIEMDVRTQKFSGKTQTFTKDVQQADISFAINYNLQPDTAHHIFKSVGQDWASKLIPQVIEGTLKAVVGQWDAEKLVSARAQAQVDAFNGIRAKLESMNVVVTNFEMTNIDYSDKFELSVESKVVAIQKAIEEQNRTAQINEQAKQRLISAQAEAKSMTIRAQALSRNRSLVEYEAVQKWDGKMPQYMLSGAMPFISLDKK